VLRGVLGFDIAEGAEMFDTGEAAAGDRRLHATARSCAARYCVSCPTRANTQPAFGCYLADAHSAIPAPTD
jgi:hypothetical protein